MIIAPELRAMSAQWLVGGGLSNISCGCRLPRTLPIQQHHLIRRGAATNVLAIIIPNNHHVSAAVGSVGGAASVCIVIAQFATVLANLADVSHCCSAGIDLHVDIDVRCFGALYFVKAVGLSTPKCLLLPSCY